jgi:hypothetical protein
MMPESAIEKQRARHRVYIQTPKGRAARARSDAKKYNKIRGSKGVEVRRRLMLKHRYGITQADYERLLTKQGGHCALCFRTPDQDRTGKLHVDHDHATGKVRGLLCHRHNHGLGMLGDNEEGLLATLKYLRGK